MDYKYFKYVFSSSLKENFQIKVGTLEGENKKINLESLLNDPLVRFSGIYSDFCPSFQIHLQVFDNGKPSCLPMSTSFKAFTKRWSWNEWVKFNVKFSDLSKNSVLAITILDCSGVFEPKIVGGTSINLFGKNGLFREGMFDLRVWFDVPGDGNYPSKTPGKGKLSSQSQMQRLGKLAKKHRNGQMQKVDWLDRLTFREIELINESEKKQSEYMYLMIEFPSVFIDEVPYHIVYFESEGDKNYKYISRPKIVQVPDPEIDQTNLLEKKHHCLARSTRSGLSDRDVKPNAYYRDFLHTIVYRYPPTYSLNSEEQDLVWKYRFYLSTHKKALTKFLKCINWQTNSEVRQAINLLVQWEPMDVEDALELLGPNFTHPVVRKYAIERLQQSLDDDLLLYLLQLVQALKYENFQHIDDLYKTIFPDKDIFTSLNENIDNTEESIDENGSTKLSNTSIKKYGFIFECSNVANNLCTFLIQRACLNSNLANYFYWYLSIEVEEQETIRKQDERIKNMYTMVLKIFLKILDSDNNKFKQIRENLDKQQKFIDELVKLVKIIVKEPGNRNKKTDKFKQLLVETDTFKINFSNFEPIPFPLDPDVYIIKIIAPKTVLFKSALMPAKLTFITADKESEYVAIFKHGDDLRQDQLILQMITLMDKLLQRENLDLKLTPYKVLATSSKHGFLQYVDSYTVADVLAREGSIQNFFRKYNSCDSGSFGISAETMDTYIKSCAGYCVITYLLGVGDRHLDNLLLTQNGKLFHIDFGYILGRDPKPMPPPMKLSKEMVEAMGGITSEHFHEFRNLCYTSYLHLRRHANVLLNLFSLMVDASIPDIALEPDKAVKKVEENLQLSLNDEEAVQYFQNLLEISITAVMPALVEQIHKFAQYWRK